MGSNQIMLIYKCRKQPNVDYFKLEAYVHQLKGSSSR